MKKNERIRLIIGSIINLIIFGLGVFCLCLFISYILRGSKDNRFRYYTNISNVTVGLIALPNAVLLFLSAIKGKMIYPKVLSIIKFMGLGMTTLTFLTVLFILAPLSSYQLMYRDAKFITHLVLPLLAIISYFFFEEKTLFEWKYSFLGFIPPVIYSIVYTINVVALKTWNDFYKINTQGIWFVYMLTIDIFGFAIAEGLYFSKKWINKKEDYN